VGLRFQCGTTTSSSSANLNNGVAVTGSGQSAGSGWKHIGFKSGTGSTSDAVDAHSILYGVTCQGGHTVGGHANAAWVNVAGMTVPGGSWDDGGVIAGAQPYTSSMVFEVKLTSTGVEWYLDGTLVHSIETSISYPLYVEAYVYNKQDPAFFNLEWV